MDLINTIVSGIGIIINTIKTIYDIIVVILCFLPSPFFEITMAFSVLLLSIFLYKFFKG